ncbi:ATP-dependent DNA helicase chl1 [Tieghemiomyces parasiticus]|uniref:ATP-dependent DNA helicase CHL1 n=1 Tax=Tieghemiomyces parasiticus TaxID=78921 RepID=A0A9W7ZRI5_9FUNG|nr:ATP-dependent DNA helicase chl1 [Tieghemiomyces parasiticus]
MVHEVRKTAYADGIRITSLGSRRTLCIHDPVRQLKSMQRINETCLDLQRKGLAANRRCPHYPAEPRQLLEFQDHALASVHDIEELVNVGRELGICPYYGTRASLPEVEVSLREAGPMGDGVSARVLPEPTSPTLQSVEPLVTLPYNLLLQKSAREALGINLKDAVVIVDEAHNLVDTITQIHSAVLTLDQVNRAASQLTAYLQKYKSRLKGSNVIYIRQILHLLAALRKFLGSGGRGLIDLNPAGGDTTAAVATATSHLLKPNELLGQLQIDNVNLFKVQKYLIESQIGKKLNMFIDRRREQEAKGGAPLPRPTGPPDLKRTEAGGDETEEWTSQRSTLPLVESFLMCLTHTDQDGRVILGLTPATPTSVPQPHLKYVLLNPHESFQAIADEARSVILAGGTMEPVDELLALLCRDTPANHIHRFNCGHVVPATSLLALTVDKGPTGRPFKFLADARGDAALTQELGQTLLNLCNIIPNGLVCFFPSYAYLHQVHAEWQRSGMLDRLHRKKAIFTEPQTSTEVEAMLAQYSSAAMGKVTTGTNGDDSRDKKSDQANGALLLSVVGGKMSEGINFGDELGRGVVMVGLPFANLGSLELQEKIRFVAAEPGTGTTPSQTEPLAAVRAPYPDIHTVLQTPKAKLYYENLCMKAVNQSIGRAIRHRGDYAVIVMLDQRFNTPRIYTKLPTWIGQRRVACPTFGPMMAQVARFFRERSASHVQPM